MQDIRRSLMIFHLKEDYSQVELQKAYKKLVKKYHPDYNQQNQEWAHQKMTEINLAYELCKEKLTDTETEAPREKESQQQYSGHSSESDQKGSNPFQREQPYQGNPSAQPLSAEFHRQMQKTTYAFCHATDIFYEYGLHNRFLRYEGNRKFRYRQCLRELEAVIDSIRDLTPLTRTSYDNHIKGIYSRFILNYYCFIILDEGDIPRHPNINSHWNKMEEYLNKSLIEYLASHLTEQFKRTSWQVSLAHCLTHIQYLQRKFPALEKEDTFIRIVRLAESYTEIRQEEERSHLRFFLP